VKWTIRIEVTLDDDNGPTTRDVGTIMRPIADLSPEQIGLTLEEGQQLLRGIQMAIIGNQVHEYELRRRLCNDCGRRQRIKASRTRGENACKPRSVRFACAGADIGFAGANFGKLGPFSFLSEKSSRGARRPRCGSSSRNWARVCRIERHREYCVPAASVGCELAMLRFGGTRSRSGGIWKHSG
jgi:hypothetical protein